MSEYFISRISGNQFRVTKFEDSDVPAGGYTVEQDLSSKKLTCQCPRWMRKATKSCRHTEMVTEFLNKGEPAPYRVER